MDSKVAAIIQRLDEQRDAYLESHRLVRELLEPQKIISHDAPSEDAPSSLSGETTLADAEARSGQPSEPTRTQQPRSRKTASSAPTAPDSVSKATTGEDSDGSDKDDEFYAQTPLKSVSYDHEGLRNHLRTYKWPPHATRILDSVVNDAKFLAQPNLFPVQGGPVPDRSHLSNHQVFDVGVDGAPLAVGVARGEDEKLSNALQIWNTIRTINGPAKERKAIGRITILRELSPILFGAAHYVYHEQQFDMDELFRHLDESESSSASLCRAFDSDERRRRTFVFNFEYFTIIGEDCRPMAWQLSDRQPRQSAHHIPISRCSSVVALSLGGKPVKKVKNPSRRAGKSRGSEKYGFAYDPFGPWHVLNLQCYPDWRSSMDVHDSTRHYVNGVEGFLVSVLAEFKDAQQRFDTIYRRITRLVTPPLDFMFDPAVRERLLFEDAAFTYTRRYFWAGQTLGIVNESIKAMIDAYESTFTDDVWSGTHPTVWPLEEQDSPRNAYFKKRMASLRHKFDVEVAHLRKLSTEIESRRAEIRSLREELYVGTSIQESRKSVENSDITVQQGHNIKILTLVSMVFLPPTFVTGVFGMTNMPADDGYWRFAAVTACVCVPFFVLIGSLNSTRGLRFWRLKTNQLFSAVGDGIDWLKRGGKPRRGEAAVMDDEENIVFEHLEKARSTFSSAAPDGRALRMRIARGLSISSNDGDGGPSVPVSPVSPVRSEPVQPSMLASMMMAEAERKRTIKYSPEVGRGGRGFEAG